MSNDRSSLTEERLAVSLKALGAADPTDVERLRRSIADLPDRSSRRWPAFGPTRIAGVAVATIAIVALAVALLPAVDRNTPAANSSTSATPAPSASMGASDSVTAVPTASPTAAATLRHLAGQVGFDGHFGWNLSSAGLAVSADAGTSWQAVALPDGLDAAALTAATTPAAAIAGASGRGLWIAGAAGDSVRVYRWAADARAWSSTLLTPHWQSPMEIPGPPNILRIVPGSGGLVAVGVTIAVGTAVAQNRLFLSTDDGRTFVERAARGADEYWHALAFATAKVGALTQGAGTGEAVSVLHTTDAGATWAASSVPAATAGFVNYGAFALEGSDLILPVTTWDQNDDGSLNATFQLLVSHDGGATFQPSGPPVGVGDDIGPRTATLGSTTWAVSSPPVVIHETGDVGRTWTAVMPVGLPEGVSSVTLTGPSTAVAVAVDSSCAGFKSGCTTATWIVRTTDGGRTWTP
jgi:photosystem II stability/assembly factor-like uncharacterized protein